MLDAGKLRNTITIQRRAGTGEDWGQQTTPTWEPVATGVRADIRHLSGIETAKADALTNVVKVSIRIRFRKGLTAQMRVLHCATVYEIMAVLPDLQRREHVDLVCEVRT